MAGVIRKNFDEPDSRDEIPLGLVELIQVGSVQVGRETLHPGWRWSTHVKPIVGTDLCEFHHVGIELSGQWICEARDGTQTLIRPGDVYDIAPGHDSWVIGDEPAVNVDFQGVAGWALPPAAGQRTLLTVLFTDIVESTAAAERMGDRRWGMLMEQHREDVQRLVGDQRGHVVKSTGDGYLATFERPAAAVACATAIHQSAHRLGLQVRAGIHTGEVELTDDDVRGMAVHLASRIADVAAAEEIVVSATTRDLVTGTDLVFEDKGTFELKGISGARTLYGLRAP